MTTNKIIGTQIIDACKAYAPLNNYVEGLFNKSLTYIRGLVLDRDEYSENFYKHCPLIILDSVSRLDGTTSEYKEYGLGIHVLVVHEDEYFDKPRINDIIVYEGIDEVEEINKLIIEAINFCDSLRCYDFADIDSFAEPLRVVSNHNEYRGYIRLNITEENDFCIGNESINGSCR